MSAPVTRAGGAQVIEFTDPADARRDKLKRKREKRSAPPSRGPSGIIRRREDEDNDNDNDDDNGLDARRRLQLVREEFSETFKEVLTEGRKGLSKRQRKEEEQKRLERLGCKPPKRASMPLPILLSMKRTHAKRAARRKEELRENGMLETKSKSQKKRERLEKEQKMRDRQPRLRGSDIDIHGTAVGAFRNGVLHLKRARK